MNKIAVYCGSSDKVSQDYLDAATQIGKLIATKGLTLVYGAGSTGMMGATARGALEANGEVIGIMPEIFNTPQLALKSIAQYEVVPDMHTRKARIAELSDAFIALPGGFGTFEEFFEIVTWAQIGFHKKPIGLLNVNGYYDTLLKFLTEVEKEGFVYPRHNSLYVCEPTPEKLLQALENYQSPPNLAKWVERHG